MRLVTLRHTSRLSLCCICEEIVANAERSRQAIAVEHLMHVCKRVNGHKGRNATLRIGGLSRFASS
jgi:hypothetical protein